MRHVVFALLVTTIVAFSGCSKKSDGGAGTTTPSGGLTTTTGPAANVTLNPEVTLVSHPSAVNVSQAAAIAWKVDLGAQTTVTVPHTAVHYASFSVPDSELSSPDDYGNTSGLEEDVAVTNAANFDTTITPTAQGTIYLRAHAIIEGQSYWSPEATITVALGMGEVKVVDIGGTTVGPAADYNPSTVNIKVGDGVKWTNSDMTVPHSATSNAGAPAAFDTGSLAAGAESAVIQFTKAGTYDYHCSVHPTTMPGPARTARVVVT